VKPKPEKRVPLSLPKKKKPAEPEPVYQEPTYVQQEDPFKDW